MLALLFATLLFTAIIVQKTYLPVFNLRQTAKTLQSNLQKKESYVNDVINNKKSFAQLKSLHNNPEMALKYIKDFTADKSIWFITLNNNKLSFWSGIKVLPGNLQAITEGYSFRQEANGYYEEIRKTEGNFSVIFFIPVKLQYDFQNQYLKNTFSPDLLTGNNIELANFNDKNIFGINSTNQTYLFSVKLKPGGTNLVFFYYQVTIWLLALIVLCILVHSIFLYIINRGYLLLAFTFLALFIVTVRFINLHFGWPGFLYQPTIFKPGIYSSGVIFSSLGNFCINILSITWFAAALYIQRKNFIKKPLTRVNSYLLFIGSIILLIAISTFFVTLFYGLVNRSTISFDISNVLNLSFFSALGILMLCFSFLIFFLLIEVFLTIAYKLSISNSNKAYLFISLIILATIITAYYQHFSLFYILWGIIVFVRAYDYQSKKGLLDAASLAIIILICSILSSIKLNYFNSIKEKETRKEFIQKLELPDNTIADQLFKKIEKRIISDPSIIKYFNDSIHKNNYIETRLQKLYFNGYLSKYEFNVHEFDKQDKPLSADKNFDLKVLKDMVIYSSIKVSDYFYRENESFGFLSYFAILPITQNGEKTGTIIIRLKSKPIQTTASFPGLLVDGDLDNADELKGYSYAFYADNKLINQSGNFVYDIINTNLKGQVGKYIYKTTAYDGNAWYQALRSYSHLIYKPSKRKLMVITREVEPVYFMLTAITFFFVVLLLFSILVILVRWLWVRIKILSIKNDRINWNFKINFDLLLYKTQIQFSMVFAVVITLLLVGVITYFSISKEFQTQQDKANRDKIHKITAAFENGPYIKYLENAQDAAQVDFDDFANDYSADLTLFSTDGTELISTQPKIYDFGLQVRRMNARAFINLKDFQKSEYANDEKIGLLNYRAFFMPIRNSAGETLAYLELPYFSNDAEYNEHIGSLLNIMINVYALVFMAIGLFAVFIARQITSPLSFIQYSLSKTIYGQKNEPIIWDRNDEIGALVKEYNKMIAALENSAQKLAQSERESAWREMAKQVAHEIKNPLTPLKLGLQLLDKSWRDKDPKFDQKFERFSKSFVEQIESLSSIASEFSAFAKMPETRLEKLNIFEILGQAVTIFKEMDNIKIIYSAPEQPFIINADRDQLLRCFNNLLKNAIEAKPPNKLGIIEINNLITNKSILLTIKDNGEGIPEGMREKIFEPNFTTKSSGTGLGLAFVKNSIENAGGKVWFETVTGEGTTFYLSLPVA